MSFVTSLRTLYTEFMKSTDRAYGVGDGPGVTSWVAGMTSGCGNQMTRLLYANVASGRGLFSGSLAVPTLIKTQGAAATKTGNRVAKSILDLASPTLPLGVRAFVSAGMGDVCGCLVGTPLSNYASRGLFDYEGVGTPIFGAFIAGGTEGLASHMGAKMFGLNKNDLGRRLRPTEAFTLGCWAGLWAGLPKVFFARTRDTTGALSSLPSMLSFLAANTIATGSNFVGYEVGCRYMARHE
ncbi:hypothetical protein KIPB_004171 [Kipferlia bialata]|uniref:Uncharacterized protein n=1 Tax=Kipferlia bialata TaxID=797122 RepID=A0A9K3CV10_9EUKA|nr:hypothetical protein KIPB_004171 [Kipferlia bialata]|eukprot:g4171.t1